VVVNVAVDDAVDVPAFRAAVGDQQAAAARRVREALAPGDEDAAAWLDRAATVRGDHEYGVCVHGDGYGTRSSSALAVGDSTWFEFADGPPCRTAYERVTIEGHI
jgi:hypothetical protein